MTYSAFEIAKNRIDKDKAVFYSGLRSQKRIRDLVRYYMARKDN